MEFRKAHREPLSYLPVRLVWCELDNVLLFYEKRAHTIGICHDIVVI